ncbi:hypothetical protein BH24DEI2_BH24DEI2_12850 [soil metagenome]
MKRLRLLLLLLLPATALAVTYRVDPTGGPDGLGAAVTEAFAAWQGLDETLEVAENEEADTVFRYATLALLGDDTLSLAVQRQGGGSLDILVTPTAGPLASNALLHETGLLLDLAVSDSGVMNPALPEEPLSLGDAEQTALSTLLTSVKEDVNRDGAVGFYDLVALAKSFGQPGINAPADINDDGLVDRKDLELLRAAYVFAPPSSTGPPQPGVAGDETLDDPDLETEGESAQDALPPEPFEEDTPPADDGTQPLPTDDPDGDVSDGEEP